MGDGKIHHGVTEDTEGVCSQSRKGIPDSAKEFNPWNLRNLRIGFGSSVRFRKINASDEG